MAVIDDANYCKIVGYPENYVIAKKENQGDYLLFNDPMVLIQSAYTDKYGPESFVHAQLTTGAIGATATTFTYSAGTGVPRLEGDYLIKVDSELIHVKGDTDVDADTGTLTVVRGAFGTEVAAHDAGIGYLQNCIKLTGSKITEITIAGTPAEATIVEEATLGDVKILYKVLPMFRDGLNLSAASNKVMSGVNPNRIYGSDHKLPESEI